MIDHAGMAFTTSDYQTNLAYRLGETSAPSDSTTKAQRLEWLNMGYLAIARRQNWWWQEASSTANTNTGSTTGYAEPSDLKEFVELKIDDVWYTQIPYNDNELFTGTGAIVTLPTLQRHFKYYRFAGRYYLVPTDSNDAETHNIKYFKRVVKITDGGSFLIPDEYMEALTAFAEARYWMSITQQAKAVAPFQEFEEAVVEMKREHSRRGWGSTGYTVKDPEDVRER